MLVFWVFHFFVSWLSVALWWAEHWFSFTYLRTRLQFPSADGMLNKILASRRMFLLICFLAFRRLGPSQTMLFFPALRSDFLPTWRALHCSVIPLFLTFDPSSSTSWRHSPLCKGLQNVSKDFRGQSKAFGWPFRCLLKGDRLKTCQIPFRDLSKAF